MSKKIGQVGVGFLAIFVLLGLLFISFEILSSRTNIFIATARETKIIEGIDKVEFTKSGLIEALEYSYTQAAFDVGNRGGFVELDDIESFSCTPYFRLFQDTNKPNEKESMERLMSKYFNEYSIELSGEVVTPAYTNFQISSDEENSIVQGFGASPILLNRQNVKIEDISDVETMVLTRLHKMYAEAKLLFIDGTPGLDGIVRDALQHRIRLADGSMPHEPGLSDDDYKSQNIGSVCEGQQRPAWVLLTRKQEAGKTNPTLCNGKIDPRLCYENNVREQLQRLEDDIEKTFDNEVDVTIDLTTLEGINLVKEYDEFKDINPEETGSSSWHTRIRIDATCNPSRVVPDLNCGCNNWQEREVPVTDEEGNIVLDGNGRPLMTTEKYCEPKDYKNRWDDVICDYFYNTVVVVKVKMEDKKYEYPVWNAETKEVEMKPLSFEFYATNGESKDIGEIYSLSEFKDKITNVCEEPVIEEPIEPIRGPTKLGLYFLDFERKDLAMSGGWAAIKFHLPFHHPEEIQLLREMRDANPNAMFVGRLHPGKSNAMGLGYDLCGASKEDIWNLLRDYSRPLIDAGVLDAVMGMNECNNRFKYNEVDAYLAGKVKSELGIEYLGSSWSFGNTPASPNDNWEWYGDALEAGSWVNEHTYFNPTLDMRWTGHRHTLWYQKLPVKQPVFFGEFNTVTGDPNEPALSKEESAERFIQYDQELQNYDYVIATTIFSVGTDGDPKWEKFDIGRNGVGELLAEYVASNPAAHWKEKVNVVVT